MTPLHDMIYKEKEREKKNFEKSERAEKRLIG